MSVKIKGFDELHKKLDDLARRAKRLDGQHTIPITELLSPSFLSRCSRFRTVDEFFAASGFKVETDEDFKAIPDEPWDEFIRENTSYGSWKNMLQSAGSEWAKRQLGL